MSGLTDIALDHVLPLQLAHVVDHLLVKVRIVKSFIDCSCRSWCRPEEIIFCNILNMIYLLHYLSQEYLGGTDMALSLNGVAEFRVKKELEKQAEGGTEEDLALRAEENIMLSTVNHKYMSWY